MEQPSWTGRGRTRTPTTLGPPGAARSKSSSGSWRTGAGGRRPAPLWTALTTRRTRWTALTRPTRRISTTSSTRAGCPTHHMLRLPLHDVRVRGAGDLGAQLQYDTAQVRAALESGLVHLPAAVFGVLCVLTAMTRLDPHLTLLTVASFTLVGSPLAAVLARTRRVAAAQLQALGRLNQRLLNCLQTLATIKTHRYETAAAVPLERAAADYGALSAAAGRLQAVVGPLVGLAQQLALMSVTVTAAHRVGAGTLSLEAASTFLLLLLCLASPLTVIALGAGQVRTGQAARLRLAALLASPVEADAPSPPGPARKPPTAVGGAVTFHDVSFAHPDSAPILSHVSFTVPATGLTLLVGPSGAGKSTALALITRLLRTDHGADPRPGAGGQLLATATAAQSRHIRRAARRCMGGHRQGQPADGMRPASRRRRAVERPGRGRAGLDRRTTPGRPGHRARRRPRAVRRAVPTAVAGTRPAHRRRSPRAGRADLTGGHRW